MVVRLFKKKLYVLCKPIALFLLRNSIINKICVGCVKQLPSIPWRERIPVKGGCGILSLDKGASITLGDADKCSIARELYWHGGRLSSLADRLALDVAIRLSAQASTFLDIGSYTGLFALAVARSHEHILSHAFEIVPSNFIVMWRNVIANDLVGRVRPHLLGIADKKASISVLADNGPGILASSIALDTAQSGVAIPIDTLDAIFQDIVGPVVMKIDVEGFEWPVMTGAAQMMKNTSPDIICEILRRAPDITNIERMMYDFNYSMYRITAEGLLPCKRIVPKVDERDWLFTRKSRSQLLELAIPVV